jgi:tetratricopeptide (TPR) repeat protein/MFS family permease
MNIEVTAGRMLARVFGASLYSWTSLIGIVLIGVSLGNYLGGRLADRMPPRRAMGLLLILASATVTLIIPINTLVPDWLFLYHLSWPQRIAAHAMAAFLVPSLLLGAIGPVAAKMALDRGQEIGRTVGSVYAWSNLGSIIGTFSAGFFLIAVIGTLPDIWLTAALLAAMALFITPTRPGPYLWTLSLTALAVTAFSPQPWAQSLGQRLAIRHDPHPAIVYHDESNYSYIAVRKSYRKGDPENKRILLLDKLAHSYTLLGQSTSLQYPYEKIYAAVTHRHLPMDPMNILVIGGGGFSYPRFLEVTYPQADIQVVEIDPAVTQAAIAAFGLAQNTSLKIHHVDGRNHVDSLLRKKNAGLHVAPLDVVYADAVNDYTVPFHLTTIEFIERVHALMKPGGIFMMTVIDLYDPGRLIGSLLNTFDASFKHTYVFCTNPDGPSAAPKDRETFTLIASDRRLDVDRLGRNESDMTPFDCARLTPMEINQLAQRANGLVLSDDYAPVENLLATTIQTAALPFHIEIMNRAIERTNEGKFGKAVDLYHVAIEAKSDFPESAFNLALLLIQIERYDEALPFLRRAFNLDTQNVRYTYALANALAESNQPAEAITLYEKTLDLNPDMTDAHVRLAKLLLDLSRYDQAAERFQRALTLQPNHAYALNNLGLALTKMGKIDQATVYFQRALSLAPNYVTALVNYGDVFAQQGRLNQARQLYQRALTVEPDNPDVAQRLQKIAAPPNGPSPNLTQ